MLSVVIPAYTITKHLEDLAIRCILSFRDDPVVEEIIFVEDGGFFSPAISNLCTTYIYNQENKGFSANVNRGWRYATGKYTAIVSSDTELMQGELMDLCVPGKVTSPEIANQTIERLAGCFWVTPMEVARERGLLFEEMKTYSSDSEYDNRVADIFQKVETVRIFHHMAQTVTAAGVEGGIEQAKDRIIYQQLISEGRAK